MPKGRLLWVLMATCALATAAFAEQRLSESLVKAAFLPRFGSFVDWPIGAFRSPNSPVQLCVVGRDPFGDTLEQATMGQTVARRPIVIRRISAISPSSGCHIAYLGGSTEQSPAAAAQALSGTPVLTVAEAQAADGAVIQFVVKDNHVRFRIDQRRGSNAGLNISSKLLNVATEVVR